jgi:hypothetical protein
VTISLLIHQLPWLTCGVSVMPMSTGTCSVLISLPPFTVYFNRKWQLSSGTSFSFKSHQMPCAKFQNWKPSNSRSVLCLPFIFSNLCPTFINSILCPDLFPCNVSVLFPFSMTTFKRYFSPWSHIQCCGHDFKIESPVISSTDCFFSES